MHAKLIGCVCLLCPMTCRCAVTCVKWNRMRRASLFREENGVECNLLVLFTAPQPVSGFFVQKVCVPRGRGLQGRLEWQAGSKPSILRFKSQFFPLKHGRSHYLSTEIYVVLCYWLGDQSHYSFLKQGVHNPRKSPSCPFLFAPLNPRKTLGCPY